MPWIVKLALEEKGHHCFLWFMGDIPTKQTNSIYCSSEYYSWVSENTFETSKISSDNFDVVWWRRPKRPFIPRTVHEHDLDFIKKENFIFYDSIPLEIAKGPWWINPYESINYANSKIYQLKLAVSSGFKVPSTLISNSPKKIKEFILSNNKSNVIYKGFSSHHWCENDRLKLAYTKSVSLEQLPSDHTLQMTPGLYQEKLKKKYELRVTCFGEYIVTVKIASQEHPKGLNDWRVIPPKELKIEPYKLSSKIENTIRIFMQNLGIVFGCFDFVVTPDDDIYFLEVNQQGQFLWIEDLVPEIKMLDIFVNFVINRKIQFHWNNYEAISLKNYETLAFKKIDENRANHVCLNKIKKVEMVS